MNTAPVLLTGSSGAIGAAIGLRVREAGFEIVETAHNAPEQENDRYIQARLPEDLERLAAALPDKLGGIVHAAGAIATHSAFSCDAATFEHLFRINVQAPIQLTARLADRLTRGSAIVFVGSVAGTRASRDNLLYGASKAALHNAAKSFAQAFAARGVRVNTVCPGLIRSPLTDATDEALGRLHGVEPHAMAAERAGRIPIGRVGEPQDVAGMVAFLLGREASFITGEEIMVTGGATL